MKIDEATNLTRIEFHGKLFCVPEDYDTYLTRGYGDYMTKPSVDKRMPLDSPHFYDLNTPYKEYLYQQRV